jgi:hypothetical protein
MIGMKDYEGYHGFGQLAQVEVDDLSKALSAGYQNPPVSGSNALRVESLEQTLRVLTFTQAHIQFWRDIPKLPAFSTVEEYNVQTSYGSEGGMFTRAGELPQVQDASYERRTALVKYVTTQREVDHPTTLVRPAHGNVVAQETQNGGIWLLERIERALYTGRSDVITEAWDGIDFQIRSDPTAAANIIDLRGGILTEDNIEDATNRIIENYGVPTDLDAAPKALSSMVKQFYPRERFNMPAPVDGVLRRCEHGDDHAGEDDRRLQHEPELREVVRRLEARVGREERERRAEQPEEEDLAPEERLEGVSVVLPHRHPCRQNPFRR